MMLRKFLLFILLLLIAFPCELYAQEQIIKKELTGYGEVEFMERQVIVRYRDGVSAARRQMMNEQLSAKSTTRVGQSPVHLLRFDNMSVEDAIENLSQHPDVQYAEPNFIRRIIEPVEMQGIDGFLLRDEGSGGLIPDDQFFSALWALKNEGQTLPNTNVSGTPGADIKAYLAWELTHGSEDVIVAVFDTGIDYTHPDLVENLFRDDEGHFGIDCSPATLNENEGECAFDPVDVIGHGTHVSGTIGAVGDNEIGITGVNWNVRLMTVKIFDDEGNTNTESILKGMEYAIENGAVISNHSYGGFGFSQSEFDSFEEARINGQLAVSASGNNGWNNDNEERVYPASYELDNNISVGATTLNDVLASFSNYGTNTVHIAAPGSVIASTYPGNEYFYFSGTSMASPHVAGVAALVKALYPDADYTEIRNRILDRADQLESLEGLIMGSRRLNALTALIEDDGEAPDAITDLQAGPVGQTFAAIEWTAVGYSGNTGFAKSYEIRISQNPITEANYDQASLVEKAVVPLNAGELQSLAIRNLSAGSTYYVAAKAEGFFDNQSEISNVYQFTTQSSPEMLISYGQFGATLSTGDTESFSFSVANAGTGPLNLQPQDRFLPSSLGDDTNGNFTYKIVNNLEETGPSFDWVDIGGIGDEIDFTNTSDGFEMVELPFSFPFYGEGKNEVYISVNGFLSFSPITSIAGTATNQNLPASAFPNDLIAVHWSDLDLSENGRIVTYHDETDDRYIIQWENLNANKARLPNIPDWAQTFQNYTFQVILYRGGAIKKQYLEVEPSTRFFTIGIEDRQGGNGELFAFNRMVIEPETALTYLPALPEWVEVTENSIELDEGESTEFNINLDARALLPGSYYTEIFISDNDMVNDPIRIPVSLSVEGESTFVKFIHNSVDTNLNRIDIFLNGRIFAQNLLVNRATEYIEIPANVDLDMELITENSVSRDDAVVQKMVHFDPDREIVAVMNGMSQFMGGQAFDLFTIEMDDQEVASDNLRLIILNGITNTENIGLFGYYTNDLPPLHILNHIPYGQFTEYVIEDLRDMELDVIQGHGLLDSFRFNINNLGGQTLLLTATGLANSQHDEPGISVLTNSGSRTGEELQKVTNEENIARHIPQQLELRQNYPNPFNPVTNILFSLPQNEHISVIVYDILGRAVRTLVDQPYDAGIHTVEFDGSNLSSGLYFYRIRLGNQSVTKKMMLVK